MASAFRIAQCHRVGVERENGKASKAFFLKKKQQKTFMPAAELADAGLPWLQAAARLPSCAGEQDRLLDRVFATQACVSAPYQAITSF